MFMRRRHSAQHVATPPIQQNGVVALSTMLRDGPAEPVPARPAEDDKPTGLVRFGGALGVVILGGVALNGAYTSYRVLYNAAIEHMGHEGAWTFPLLIDALIFGATLRYIYRVKAGYRAGGWRFLVWLFSGMTMFFNVLASPSTDDLFWHLVAPSAWVAITEIAANDILGDSRRARRRRQEEDEDLVPRRSWVAWVIAPIETPRLVWREIRSRVVPVAVRQDRAVDAAIRIALRRSLPGPGAWATRRVIRRHVADQGITPAAVLTCLTEAQDTAEGRDLADRVLTLVTARVLEGKAAPRRTTPAAPKPRPMPTKTVAPAPNPSAPTTPEGTGNRRRLTEAEEREAYDRYAQLRREREAKGLDTTTLGADGYISNGEIARCFTPALDVKGGERRRKAWEQQYAQQGASTAAAV